MPTGANAQPLATGARRAPALEVRGLSVAYGARLALEDVSFELPAGALVGVIGPNGAGKSTLLKAILGLVPRAAGSVRIGGVGQARRGHQVAYVPQRDAINWRFPASVADVALMGRYGRLQLVKHPAHGLTLVSLDRAVLVE
ncbi:MAG TPA: ATP-binding cassette domain-containing protein, partial [Kouleothrix sp.]|nr:ATP-binding cassette domain-containing protein [Kouleothrix sp.]